MSNYLLSFSTPTHRNAQHMLNNSSQDKGFDGVISYTENNLPKSFLDDNNLIMNNSRGYGYWLWKPFIILETLKQAEIGDIIFYMDSSNIILEELTEFLSNVEDISLFENKDSNPNDEVWVNKDWTKRDCFVIMGCDEDKYWNGKQANASYQCYRKTSKSLKFLDEMYSFCRNENIMTDIPNIHGSNLDGFKDHRHDQSVLSLMAIKNDILLNPDPSRVQNTLDGNYHKQLFYHCRGKY